MAESESKPGSLYEKLYLKCPQRDGNKNGFHTAKQAWSVVQMHRPPGLTLKRIGPSMGEGKWPCGWSVEFLVNRTPNEIPTDECIYDNLFRFPPHNSKIIRFRKGSVLRWKVEYGILNCGCPPAINLPKKKKAVGKKNAGASKVKPAIKRPRKKAVAKKTAGASKKTAPIKGQRKKAAKKVNQGNATLVHLEINKNSC